MPHAWRKGTSMWNGRQFLWEWRCDNCWQRTIHHERPADDMPVLKHRHEGGVNCEETVVLRTMQD